MAYIEWQYNELSDFPVNNGDYIFLNERITRTGALQCLCKKKGAEGKAYEIELPTGEFISEVLCPYDSKFLGFFSLNYLLTQTASLNIVIYSYILRAIYKFFIRKVYFTSKSFELFFIIISVCMVYSLNYSYLYLKAPRSDYTEQAKT